MFYKINYNLRLIAVVLAAAMLMQDAALAAPDVMAAVSAPMPAGSPLSAYGIPPSVAIAGDSFLGTNDGKGLPRFILIEDAHTNPSGQINLASTLDAVLSKHQLNTVLTEGSDRDVSLSTLRRYGSANSRAKAAMPFVRKGELKGSEYLELTRTDDFAIVGVEDRRLYDQAVNLYAEAASARPKIAVAMERVDAAFEAVGEKILNPRLRGFETAQKKHASGELDSAEYFAMLFALGQELGIKYADLGQLERLDRLRKIEKSVDFARAAAEWDVALESVPDSDRAAIGGFGAGPARRNNLEAMAAAGARFGKLMAGRPLDGALKTYLKYLKALNQLDAHQLLKQAEAAEQQIESRLAVTAEESRFVRLQRASGHLWELSDLSLTPTGAAYLDQIGKDARLDRITGFLNRQIMMLGLAPERAVLYEQVRDKDLRAAWEFYQIASERDDQILERSLAAAAERGLGQAVLITGGFHTRHLTALLRDRGIAYQVITPQVYEETDRARYERLLLAQVPKATAAARTASALIPAYSLETPGAMKALEAVFQNPEAESNSALLGARLSEDAVTDDQLRAQLQPILDWIKVDERGDAAPTARALFASDSLRAAREAGEDWRNRPTPMWVLAGLGAGSRTLEWLRKHNDLKDPAFEARVFRRVDQILDALKARHEEDMTEDKTAFWEYVGEHYGLSRWHDQQKDLPWGFHRLAKSAADSTDTTQQKSAVTFNPAGELSVEEWMLLKLMDPATRQKVKITEAFIYEAILLEAGVNPSDLRFGAQSATTNEQIYELARMIRSRPEGWKIDRLEIIHNPLTVRRGINSLRGIWEAEDAELLTEVPVVWAHTPFEYDAEKMNRDELLYIANRALGELKLLKTKPDPDKGIPAWVKDVLIDENILANETALVGLIKRIKDREASLAKTYGVKTIWKLPIPKIISFAGTLVAAVMYRKMRLIGQTMKLDEELFRDVLYDVLRTSDLMLVKKRALYHVTERDEQGQIITVSEREKTFFRLIGWQQNWLKLWSRLADEAPDPAQRLWRMSMAEFLGETGLDNNPETHSRISSQIFEQGRTFAYQHYIPGFAEDNLPIVETIGIPLEGGDPIPARLIRPRIALGEKVPVGFIGHGFGMSGSSSYFDELEEKLLAHGIAVIRLDLLNHGLSQRPLGSADQMEAYNNAIARYIRTNNENLDVTRVGMYGFSFGAYLGMRALFQSELGPMIRHLFLMNPPTAETFTRSHIIEWHQPLLEELFPSRSFQEMIDSLEGLQLPLSEIVAGMSEDEKRQYGERITIYQSNNDETVHFRDQEGIRGIAAEMGAKVIVLENQGHFPVGEAYHRTMTEVADGFAAKLVLSPRRSVHQGLWNIRVRTVEDPWLSHELFEAAKSLATITPTHLAMEIKEKVPRWQSLKPKDLTGEADISYLAEGAWKWVIQVDLKKRDGNSITVVIVRPKNERSFDHDELGVIRAAQGRGAPALICELPQAHGLPQLVSEYVDGTPADVLWSAGDIKVSDRQQLVVAALRVASALGGWVPRDYANRANYIVDRPNKRGVMVDLGNDRIQVDGSGADPWQQVFFLAGLADRFGGREPNEIREQILQPLVDEWGEHAYHWLSVVNAHLLISDDAAVINRLTQLADPDRFGAEGELVARWREDPGCISRLRKALRDLLANQSWASQQNMGHFDVLVEELKSLRAGGVSAPAAVINIDAMIYGGSSSDTEDVFKAAAEHVLAGGWVIWFTSYGKEIWYERFQSRWQGWLRDHNASGPEETRSAVLVSGGRELLIKDADGSGWKGFVYPAELKGVADAVNWAAERWSKVAGLKVARAITYFYSSTEARSGMSAELSLLRSAMPAPAQQSQKIEDEGKLRLPMDDPGLVSGFVWSARYRENGDWDPDTLYLSPIQGSGGGLGAEMPATAEVYSVYRIHEGHQVEGLAAGGWDNSNYSIEQPTDVGARMAVAAPMNSGGQRPVNQTMMALSVRDLGAVEMPVKGQTKMGVDMAKGLREVEALLPVIASQGTRTLYLYGVLSSGTMSEDIHTAPDGPAHAVFSRDGRVAVMESGYPKHRENIGGRSMDNSAGSMFSSYDLGAVHPGSLPKGVDVAAKQAELEEQLKNLIRLAFKEYGISIYLDFIPWRAPDAVTAENYKSFYYRELSAPEQKEYDLLPPGDNAKRRTWISSILKKAGDFTAVRVPKADGTGETLIFTRRADIGIASEDQVVPNPFHPQTQRYWIENLKRFVDWGVAGVRVDLGWRILADWQYQYYNEMRGFLGRRGVKLEDWMRSAGINDLAAGETFEVWWERQKRLAMPWRQIISEVGAYSRMVNRKPFDFIIEVYQEAYSAEVKQLLALGVKRNYDDRFFKAIVDGVLNKKEGLLDAVRKAVEASPHGVIFLSNYDQNALMNLLEEAGAVDAKEGLQLIISVLGRLGVPVMIDGREFIEEHGQAVPMVGGGKRGKDDFHAYAWSKELDRRREDGWAAKAFAGAPWSELLQTLEQKLGKPVSPKDMWVPRNTSANNRYVPIFWRDPERGWFLMLADTHPSWGPEYNYGPGRIKIELTASELPASMDPDAFAANFDRAQSVLISGANVWRAGLSDWNSPTSTERTLDIDLDPNGFKSANLLIYLGPAKAVRESADPIKHIFVDTTIPGDREELLLSLLRDQHTSPEMASQALWMAIADPHENVRATAANVLAQWHLEYGGPAQTAETWTQSLLDPLAVREVLGAAQPGYDAKHGRRNGRYAVLHALKLLSWMSRGEWPSGGEGQSYADSVIERVRSQIKLDAQSWDAKKEVRVRRTVRAEIKATHPNRRSLKHPEFEWDRDLSLGSDQLNSILQILRAVVVRSEEVAAHYPDSRRDTFYWVLEAVHEIVPDVPGDIAADAVYRGALPAGARMAEAYGVVIAEDHLEDPVLATRFTKLDAERGLHARPSDAVSLMADYVNLAAQMAQKKVWLRVRRAPEALSTNSDEETSQGFADLNSVLSLLTLGVTDGTELALEIGGTLSQQEADSLADIFAQLLSDRVTLSRGLNSSPVAKNEYRDRIYHVFDPEGTPLDSPLKARAHLRWNRVDRFLAQVIEAHPADQRAHIAIERDDETLAVFQVWRDKKTVWYALKGQAGRLRVEKVGSELPSNLPVYTPMIDLDTDSDSDRRIMPDAAVSLDIALAGDLIHWAGAWLGVDLKDAPLRANVELDEDDLIRRIGYGRDREAAEDLRRRLKIIQTHIHDMGMGRLLFKGQTDAIAGAPTARLFHPSNAGYADEANPGTLKWSYLQEDSEILPVLSSAILSALILAAPEEGKVSYLAALSPLYQRLIGSSDPNDVLTPELIEAARSNPGLLKPIKPLTLRGYLDVAVYLQELGRQAARMAA